ncbi:MAG: hypothetical protein IH862_06695, partial [Chloroflexi bacterium]|nr:hypothetical protein [Chloroflexota bacterium]
MASAEVATGTTGLDGEVRFGVVVFPGTWSDTDCYHVIKNVLRQPVEYLWHKETDLSSYDCVVLPGG